MFCRSCASGAKGKLFEINPGVFAAAAGIGVAAAIFGGWILTNRGLSLGTLFELVLGFIYGTGLGELILRVTGRKRGTKMEVLAGALPIIGLLVGRIINETFEMPGIASVGLFSPVSLCLYAVAAYGAVNRVRFL